MNLACITVYWCILASFCKQYEIFICLQARGILMHFTSSLEIWCTLQAVWKFDVLCKQPGFLMYSARKIKCWFILQARWSFLYYCKPDGSLMHFASKTDSLWILKDGISMNCNHNEILIHFERIRTFDVFCSKTLYWCILQARMRWYSFANGVASGVRLVSKPKHFTINSFAVKFYNVVCDFFHTQYYTSL